MEWSISSFISLYPSHTFHLTNKNLILTSCTFVVSVPTQKKTEGGAYFEFWPIGGALIRGVGRQEYAPGGAYWRRSCTIGVNIVHVHMYIHFIETPLY